MARLLSSTSQEAVSRKSPPQLDIGFARLLYIAQILAGDLGDGERVERVLIAAHEREQEVERALEVGEVTHDRNRDQKAAASLRG
jgi:hypothetical protein